MAHRELAEWERCGKSSFTGAHGWALMLETKNKVVRAEGVRCTFCSLRPPREHEERLFAWMFADEKERRRHLKTEFIAVLPVAAA